MKTKWVHSFRDAFEGLKYALSTQRNMRFHFFAAGAVLCLALYCRLRGMEIIVLMLSITLVIVTELINTALEKAVDLSMPDRHPLAKIAKDAAAASVFVTAVFAAAVGIIVFYAPLDRLLGGVRQQTAPVSADTAWIYLVVVALIVIALQTLLQRNSLKAFRPGTITAAAFSVSTFITLDVPSTIAAVLAFFLAALTGIILYEKPGVSLASLILGGMLGMSITSALFYLLGY